MTHLHLSMSAPIMSEQAVEAYEELLEAELAYADSARHAVQNLGPEVIRAAMTARARWRAAVETAVLATDRLGDSNVRPEDLPLGHAVVDCWDPNQIPTPYTPRENDLGATPEGTLWIGRSGQLIEGEGRKSISTEEFRARGGVLMRHQDRWVMFEEALASRFPLGTQVCHTGTGMTAMVKSPRKGVSPWRASYYFARGSVFTDRGWWVACFLEPAVLGDADET